jgi:hypothetical protein
MYDYELDKSSINFYKISMIPYNNYYLLIENTNCLVGYKNQVLPINDIIKNIKNNINYKSNTILQTLIYDNYLLILI